MAGNIREESAPQGLGLNPTEMGIDATLQSARRIGTFYNQTADLRGQEGSELKSAVADAGQVAVDYMDHREISAGAANGAQFMANMNAAWEDKAKNADPNDTTVAAKFNAEQLEPALDQFKQGFSTEKSQAWAEHFVDQYRNHMFEKTTATMSSLAGEAVKVNVAKTINGLSSAVSIDPSTHSIDNAFSVLDHSVGAMVDSSPNIDVTTGAKIKGELAQDAKEKIVKAAVASMIGKNPNIDLDAIQKKYGDYIKGDEMKQFQVAAQRQAKSEDRAARVDQAYQRLQQKQATQDASEQREGEYLEKLHSDDPKVAASVSASAVAKDWTLTVPARERTIRIINQETKPEASAVVSSRTAQDIFNRINLPAGDPNRVEDTGPINDAYSRGELNKADLKFVRDELVSARSPEGQKLGVEKNDFLKGIKPLIDKSNPLLGKIDFSGPQNFYEYSQAVTDKMNELRTTPGKDPRDVFRKGSPDYMGSPEVLAHYQKDIKQSIDEQVQRLKSKGGAPANDTTAPTSQRTKPALPPRNAGESPDEYLKRTGLK